MPRSTLGLTLGLFLSACAGPAERPDAAVDAVARTVTWTVRESGRHGVERLDVGDGLVSLIAAERSDLGAPLRIEGTSERALELVIRRAGRADEHRDLSTGPFAIELE